MTNALLARLWPSAYANGLIKIVGKPATTTDLHRKPRVRVNGKQVTRKQTK